MRNNKHDWRKKSMGINKQIFAGQLLSTSIPSNLSTIDQQKWIESLRQNAYSLLPDRLYRYRACSERSIDAFDKNELCVSTADCMNDGYSKATNFPLIVIMKG